MNTNTHTYKITVVEPCDCRNCQAGKRWFMCLGDRPVIAEYKVTQNIALQPEQVAYVQAHHPGMNLIY